MLQAAVLLALISASAALRPGWMPGNYAMTEDGAQSFANDYNSTAEEVFYFSTDASWKYNTNLTDHNSQQQVSASLEEQEFTEVWGKKAKDTFPDSFLDNLNTDLKNILKKTKVLGPANLPTTERERYNTILSQMDNLYSTAKVCPSDEECWSLEPGEKPSRRSVDT